MLTTALVAGLVIVFAAVFLFIARRVLRFAAKAAFVFAVALALLLVVALGWWRGWLSSPVSQHAATQSNSRSTSNRRR